MKKNISWANSIFEKYLFIYLNSIKKIQWHKYVSVTTLVVAYAKQGIYVPI